jgi:transposase
VRRPLAGLPREGQVQTAVRFRPRGLAGPAEGTRAAMASVARRHQALRTEIARLDAALCGASPVDASSGKQLRHRLNRGSDRQANSALWRIVITRMAHEHRTQAYVARRTAKGKSKKEIIRCLIGGLSVSRPG